MKRSRLLQNTYKLSSEAFVLSFTFQPYAENIGRFGVNTKVSGQENTLYIDLGGSIGIIERKFSDSLRFTNLQSDTSKEIISFGEVLSTSRVVNVWFKEPSNVSQIYCYVMKVTGDYPLNAVNYPNINTFYSRYCGFTKYPSFLKFDNLKYISIHMRYASRLQNEIPLDWFKIPLETMSFGSYSWEDKDGITNTGNIDKFYLWRSTLKAIFWDGNSLTTGFFNAQPIHDSLKQLNNLLQLNCRGQKISTLPLFLNSLSPTVGGACDRIRLESSNPDGDVLVNWSLNSSFDTDLRDLTLTYNTNLSTNFDKIIDFPKLTVFDTQSSFITTERVTEAVDKMYELMDTNYVEGSSIFNSRLSWKLQGTNLGVEKGRLAGIYQAPSDWDNSTKTGTPQSSLEKVWVLANKFGIDTQYLPSN